MNYRSSLDNKLEKSDNTSALTYLNGSDAPNGQKIAPFMTLDLSGSIANMFDRKPATDFRTYGAIGH
ncbi:hypothetical protein [Roseateles saccharophilus]|uniref:Uncharacterized protein n=1 Tax=Roseateles saccharophilus TaxID=304 RepID=A0A4R3VJH4_ROSSA|nr:hypothetical protein [Roseateles saccharophilus]MDG0831173.1 hypothetical protein [Roseateles saccharophilus]TCV04293.1 hypothetical protein EV671_100148 [Roseateles saccharophilus]